MDLVKIKTVYDETLYIDRDEYTRKIGKGRKLLRLYYSTGRPRTIRRGWKKGPEPLLPHVENIQAHCRELLRGQA